MDRTASASRAPQAGERFPDIVLPDQHGRPVDLHAARGTRNALVVFYRSARWWPYCKTQLVELQRILPELDAAGYALFAISYDPVASLGTFAEAHGITYPLLADEGSRTIGALGLLDTELVAHHAVFGVPTRDDQHGVPFPTTFVLDTDGRIVRTIVEESYRVRTGGRRLLVELLGASPAAPPDAPRGAAHEQVVSASVRLDSPTYYAYQRLGLQVELAIAPGWHVYGPSTPAGYVPMEIAVTSEPAGARIGPIEWPAAQPFHVTGLDEEFAVYDGTVRIDAPVEFIIGRGSGTARLDVRIAFQACSATECFAPSVITVSLTVPEAPTL